MGVYAWILTLLISSNACFTSSFDSSSDTPAAGMVLALKLDIAFCIFRWFIWPMKRYFSSVDQALPFVFSPLSVELIKIRDSDQGTQAGEEGGGGVPYSGLTASFPQYLRTQLPTATRHNTSSYPYPVQMLESLDVRAVSTFVDWFLGKYRRCHKS